MRMVALLLLTHSCPPRGQVGRTKRVGPEIVITAKKLPPEIVKAPTTAKCGSRGAP